VFAFIIICKRETRAIERLSQNQYTLICFIPVKTIDY